MTDLKPCPFCGGLANRHDITSDDEVGNVGGSCIVCPNCQACGPVQFGEKATLAEHWNTRYIDAETLATLKKAHAFIAGFEGDTLQTDIDDLLARLDALLNDEVSP